MNLPNKLTMLRIIMIPVIIFVYYYNQNYLIMLILFIGASITDYLDGYIARKYDLVTNFGKLMDPLADKLLIMASLLLFIDAGVIATWIVIIILSREFLVSGIRLVAGASGKVIVASKLGKAKTFLTMLTVIILYFNMLLTGTVSLIGTWLIYLSLFLTVISGLEYGIKNKEIVFSER